MFYGFAISKDKPHELEIPDGCFVSLSQIALDTRDGSALKDGSRATITMSIADEETGEKEQFVIATLVGGRLEQAPLDLELSGGSTYSLGVSNGTVHVCGSFHAEDEDEEDDEDLEFDEEDEEIDSEEENESAGSSESEEEVAPVKAAGPQQGKKPQVDQQSKVQEKKTDAQAHPAKKRDDKKPQQQQQQQQQPQQQQKKNKPQPQQQPQSNGHKRDAQSPVDAKHEQKKKK